MDVDSGGIEGQGDNWSIYRDPFTSTSLLHADTNPKPKPWERAAVSAHAPRLAGQKIWKKASSLHSSTSHLAQNQDKENAVQVELEIERGGMGPRKRRRGAGMGSKENLGEAKFISVNAGGLERAVDGGKESSPRKMLVLINEDAFVVPSKRTYADHHITPRKPLRHIENIVAVPVLQTDEQQTRESQATSTRIPLNDGEGVKSDQKENPGRRTSMRKSRRLTRSDSVVGSVGDRRASFVFGQKVGDGDLGSFSGLLDQDDFSVPVVKAADRLEPVSSESTVNPMDTSTQQATPILEINETSPREELAFVQHPVESKLETSSGNEELSNTANRSLEEQPALETIVESAASEFQSYQAAAESRKIQSTGTELVKIETIIEQPPRTPLKARIQPEILQAVASDMAVILSPTKSLETPRSRKKTPRRSATRRSTRTTRNISLSREESSSYSVPISDGMDFETAEFVTGSADAQIQLMDLSAPVDTMESLDEDGQVFEQVSAHRKDIPDTSSPMSVFRDEDSIKSNTINEAARTTETIEDFMASQPEVESIAEAVDDISDAMDIEKQDEAEEGSPEQLLRQEFEICTTERANLPALSLSLQSKAVQEPTFSEDISEESAESYDLIEPISNSTSNNAPCSPTDEANELQESSTPDPTTTELTETISENAPSAVYDHDDTDMLRNFLSKVKANKAAKAKTYISKRKRSLPHSPLQIPLASGLLGDIDATSSPSPKAMDEFDVSLPTTSPRKRGKRNKASYEVAQGEDVTEPQSIRRSGRTRFPVKAAPAALSFIPVRRIGQDGDSTVTLRRNEEKELAALTKINTSKNKAGASHAVHFLAKKADEKINPASRKRALKEAFDEKNYKQKLNKKGNGVVWAEELTQFQTGEGEKVVAAAAAPGKEGKKDGKNEATKFALVAEKEPEREKEKHVLPGDEKKCASTPASISTSTPKVGLRSKMTLGMAAIGTPAVRRRARGRS